MLQHAYDGQSVTVEVEAAGPNEQKQNRLRVVQNLQSREKEVSYL